MRVVIDVLLGAMLGAWCAAAIGCGAGQPKASRAAPAVQDRGTGDLHAETHAEIDALDRQIADELVKAQVAPPAVAMCSGPACTAAISQPFATPVVGDAQCHPAKTDKCSDACTLSTSICTNQQKICDLAKQLVGDDWAANKCESAKASCQAAHDSCCRCVL